MSLGTPTVPTLINSSSTLLYGNTASGNALTVQQLGAGNVVAFSNASGSLGLFVSATSNVGIGLTNPSAQLHVYGAGQATQTAFSTTGNLGGSLILQDSGVVGNNGGAIVLGANQGYFAVIKGLLRDGTTNTIGDISIATRNAVADTTLTNRVYIQAGGNVGIGLTNPSYILQVVGSPYSNIAVGNGTGAAQIYYNDIATAAWYTTTTNYIFAWYNGTVGGSYTARMSLTNGGNLSITGALSKGSGTFEIPHPILPEPKRLCHSFIEGPRCDLIYRGSVQLVNGKATVNIDSDCTSNAAHAMTQGTFEALCANPVCFLQNDDSFDRIKGKVSGNLLTITCENVQSSDMVNWMVVAERKDPFIKKWDRTDPNGFLIPEFDAPQAPQNPA